MQGTDPKEAQALTRYGEEYVCDLCGETVTREHGAPLPDNWLWVGVERDKETTGHVCPSCRYSGAGHYIAGRQYAGNRIGIEISGGLRSVFQTLSREHARVAESGYRLTLTAPDFDPTEQAEIVKRELTELYHAMSLMESTLGNVINELEYVGWPIAKAYLLPSTMEHRKKHWPNKPKSTT